MKRIRINQPSIPIFRNLKSNMNIMRKNMNIKYITKI